MNRFNSLHDLFFDKLYEISEYGSEIHSNGSTQTELLFQSFVLNDPTRLSIDFPSRKFNENYSVMEFLWYLSQNKRTNNIGKHAGIWLKIKDNQDEVESNYGTYILGEQWDWIKSEFNRDIDSRRCTIVIHQPHHKTKNKQDLPCTQYLQFFIRNNELHLGVNMRSNDVIFGLCNDVYTFALFQQLMLNDLREIYPDLELGSYYHYAGSLHLYEAHYDMRDKIYHDNVDASTKSSILHRHITTDYIIDNKLYMPVDDMTKDEILTFTKETAKKLFI